MTGPHEYLKGKVAIIADIHGNLPALEEVLCAIDAQGCDCVICLGDVAGYYPMINECIELLRERQIHNILGNHDWYLTNNKPCPRSRSANDCLNYQRSVISEENLAWLSESVESIENDDISMRHGGWNEPIDEYLYKISETYFTRMPQMFFVSGHTHVQSLTKFRCKTYCNPGSVGQPRDGDWRAAYAVWSQDKILLHRVEYDVDRVASAMKQAGFSEHFYENLYKGTRIGGEISSVKIVSDLNQ